MPLPDSTSQVREGMRVSILDGIFAVPYVNLTSGPILIGFLLALGASTAQIGFVSMLPLAGGLIQPIGAQLIRRRGGWRKPVVVTGVLLDDVLWAATLVAVAMLPAREALIAALAVLVLQHVITAFVSVSWTSWMSDLVPPSLRGRYFGRRNFICNAVGAGVAILAGQFISRVGGGQLWSFGVVIAVAIIFRLLSARLLSGQPEPVPEQVSSARLSEHLFAPLSSSQFRRYAEFGMAWGFACYVASPFFAVYMIRDLRIGFGAVMVLAAISTITNLIGQRVWGPLSDRYGHLPVMKMTVFVVALQPFWWLFAASSGFGFSLIVFAHVIGGFTWGGYQLASGNLMMALAPNVGKSSFFAVQAAMSGMAGAVGPLAGGLLADNVLPYVKLGVLDNASTLPLLFALSLLLRLASWGMLYRVEDPSQRPRLRMAFLVSDALRTSNITQGFSPLLHRIAAATDDRRPLEEALLEFERRGAQQTHGPLEEPDHDSD